MESQLSYFISTLRAQKLNSPVAQALMYIVWCKCTVYTVHKQDTFNSTLPKVSESEGMYQCDSYERWGTMWQNRAGLKIQFNRAWFPSSTTAQYKISTVTTPKPSKSQYINIAQGKCIMYIVYCIRGKCIM